LPVSETDEERQARIYPIILDEYNPAWPDWFEEEKAIRLGAKKAIVQYGGEGFITMLDTEGE